MRQRIGFVIGLLLTQVMLSEGYISCVWAQGNLNQVRNLVTFRDHQVLVNSIAFSPDGKLLASGSADKTIRLRNLSNPRVEPLVLEGHNNWVNSIAFSPDGKLLASGGEDRTIRLWDLNNSNAEPLVLEGHQNWVNSIAFSPDGQLLASGGDDNIIRLWDLSNLKAKPLALQGHQSSIWSVAFSLDGELLASGSADKTIRLWSFSSPKAEPLVLQGHQSDVSSVAFSPDGKVVASGSADKTIRLWNLSNPKGGALVLEGHQDFVRSVTFSPDGKMLASGSVDRTIRLWNLSNPSTRPMVLEGHQNGISSVAFSPDGRTLASGSRDNTIRLWGSPDGTAVFGARVPTATTASLMIRASVEGAQVLVDENLAGSIKDGLLEVRDLKPGSHNVVVRAEGYQDRTFTTTLSSGQTSTIEFKLTPLTAALEIRANVEGASVFVGGQLKGTIRNGVAEITGLQPGTLTVLLKADGYNDVSLNTTIAPGGKNGLNFNLTASVPTPTPPIAQPPIPPADTSIGVRIIDPVRGDVLESLDLSLRLFVLNPSRAPLTFDIFLRGERIKQETLRNIGVQGEDSITINLRLPDGTPAGDVRLSVVARSSQGITSPTESITLHYRPKQAQQGRLRVLAVGISQYADPEIPALKLADKDARDLVRLLEAQKGKVYSEVETRLLTNAEAKRRDIVLTLERWKQNSNPEDTILLFFSGHGFNNGLDYYIPVHDSKLSELAVNSISQRDLEDFLLKTLGRVLLLIDTCYSGSATKDPRGSSPQQFVNRLSEIAQATDGRDRVIMAATQGSQVALEKEDWGNGAFTLALLEALSGKGANDQGEVTISRLFDYVSTKVPSLTNNLQRPQIKQSGGNFVLAQVR